MPRPSACATRWIVAVSLFLPPSALLAAAEDAAPNATVRASMSTERIDLDGRLDEAAWSVAGTIADLTQQDPQPGVPTPFRTEIRFLSDGRHLFVGVRCFDPRPDEIAVHALQRDAELSSDDTVTLVLDTFGDRQTGYLFRVNAAGARQDGLIAAGDNKAAFDWDGIWDARAVRSASGWTAEIAIDARTLRFRPGAGSWGLNVERNVPRDRLTLRWTAATPDAALVDLRRAGVLLGLEALRQGKGIELSPYGLARAADTVALGRSSEADGGFDLAYNVTSQLGVLASVNTDFAETEVDSRKVNLTRFPLFFPEKRGFFLEGSNFFRFGSGIEDRFIPFFSRRVGLFEGGIVPLDAGVKVLGNAGRWSIGALGVATRSTDAAPASRPFVGRVTYDVGHLRVGSIVTQGNPDGVSSNRFAGVDVLWRTATFRGDKNLAFSGWSGRSDGDLEVGESDGWGFKVDYPNDLWDLFAQVDELGDALDPALGCLPRRGVRIYRLGGAFQPRPLGGAFDWIRQFFFETFDTQVDDLKGNTESWRLFTAPWNVATESGERLEANFAPQFERLDQPFEVADGVVIPPGDYRFDRYRVEAQSSRSRLLQVGATVWFGGFYTGRLTQLETFANWATLAGRLKLELEQEIDTGVLPEGDFVQRLWRFKTVYALSPDAIFSSLVQYDSDSQALGVNTVFRWTFSPGRDLFVVWDRDAIRPLESGPTSFTRLGDQVAVKARWNWRW